MTSFSICAYSGSKIMPQIDDNDKQQHLPLCVAPITKRLVGYIPLNSEGVVSCLARANLPKCTMTTDNNLVVLPSNSIIDSIEFFGSHGFNTKDEFSIGLGQLNQNISVPLINGAVAEIANEKIGGCRHFFAVQPDGSNDRNLVLVSSNINVSFAQPVLKGNLMVIVYYHSKP